MMEIPEIPAPPPPRKSAPWKIIVPIVVVVVLCCLCLVVVGVLVYLGTQGTGPFASLQNDNPFDFMSQSIVGDWDLYYDWGCSGKYNGPATVTFYANGTYYAYEGDSGGYGTWTLQGKVLNYIYDTEPYANYIGTLNNSMDYVEGTMSTSTGSTGCFYANKR